MFIRSRRRLARWFTLTMGSILIGFAGVIYYIEAVDELEALDSLLYKKSRVIAANATYDLHTEKINLENVPMLGSSPRTLNTELVYARWYSPQRQLVRFFGTPPLEQLTEKPGYLTIKTDTLWFRQLTLPVYQKDILLGYLQTSIPLTSVQDNLSQLRLGLILTVPVTLGIVGIASWFLAGLVLQPVRQAYDQLQRFTADASHELRSPLAAIMSNAQVGLMSEDESQQQFRLEKITRVVRSMSALISNLLFLARHVGQLAPEALPEIELTSVLKELADSYASRAAAQDLNLASHITPKSVTLPADPDLLFQAVSNLLNNACNYTPAGGQIELCLFTQSGKAVIQVADSGIGIPEEDLPHIFERFYRVDTERSRSTGGFGLGLSIVQQIVEAHGGKIYVSSQVGKGTTFTIKLPL